MAKVRGGGRDVIVELMETVVALREESRRTQAQLDALGKMQQAQFEALGKMQAQFEALGEMQQTMVESLSALSAGAKRQEGHLGRLAKLLSQMAENTTERFERLEARVGAIEAGH